MKHLFEYKRTNISGEEELLSVDIVPIRELGKKSIIGLKIIQQRVRDEVINGVPYRFNYGANYEHGHIFFDKPLRSNSKNLNYLIQMMEKANFEYLKALREQ